MVQINIKKLSERLGIKALPADHPLYTTAPEIRFMSQSGKSTTDTPKNSESPKVISIDYGYDIHSLEISDSEWQLIQSGKQLEIEGQGFWVEGEFDQDYWCFNSETSGTLGVSCESGREIFTGSISDLMVDQGL